jgi:hypothetical protein
LEPSIREELFTVLGGCPWLGFCFGVVSLLDVLKYAAEDFIEITKIVASIELAPQWLREEKPRAKLEECLERLLEHTYKFDLQLTRNQIGTVSNALAREDWNATQRELDQLLRRVLEELKARSFRYVEKPGYELGFWLSAYPGIRHNHDIRSELESAGRCYAYDEDTACVFHLMRAVDYGLRLVAKSLGVDFDARSWDGIGKAIEKKMRERYQDKTDAWKTAEPFYAEILTDIQAISRGHRNPVLHELEKAYDKRAAEYLLTVTVGFIEHVLAHTAIQNPRGE